MSSSLEPLEAPLPSFHQWALWGAGQWVARAALVLFLQFSYLQSQPGRAQGGLIWWEAVDFSLTGESPHVLHPFGMLPLEPSPLWPQVAVRGPAS